MKYVPGVLGALCLVACAALIFWPAAFGVAGVLCLALDRQVRV